MSEGKDINVPSNDLISRQEAIDALNVLCQEHRYKIPGKKETYSQYNEAWQDALDRAEGAIFNLPSVQPKQRWIPCSERLPKDDDWKIVTILDGHGDTPYRYSDFGWYLDKAECWIIDAEQRTDVIAWMLLPEPYNQMFPTQMSETLSAGRRPTEWKEEKDDETRSD